MTVNVEAPASQTIADLESDSLIGSFPDGQRLVGTRCDSCGRTMIGSRIVCSVCVSQDVSRVALPDIGILYSFTRVHVGGDGVRAIGYVDLDGDVRTLADIREGSTSLRPDMQVQLAVDGDDWFFSPRDGD